MESYTQLVELYGLPACGKSTLANYIDAHYANEKKIASIHKGKDEIRRNKFKFFLSLPIRYLFIGYKFTLFFTNTRKCKNMSLFDLLTTIYVKNYNIKHSQFRYIVDDNSSLIQQIVSWEHGDDFHSNPMFRKKVNDMLDCFPRNIYVYCQLSIDKAIDRIKIRNRHVGRLDKIAIYNPERLQQEYLNEISRFEKMTELLEEKNRRVFRINMDREIGDVLNQLLCILEEKEL